MKKRKKVAKRKKTSKLEAHQLLLDAPPKKKGGPASIYTTKLTGTICSRLSKGESLRSICRDEEMPNIDTIMNWLFDGKHKDFEKDYERARAMQAEVVFEQTSEFAEKGLLIVQAGKTGTANARVNALKLLIDTRKWALGRMAPKRFGDKLDVTSGGKEMKQPRPVAIKYMVPVVPKTA